MTDISNQAANFQYLKFWRNFDQRQKTIFSDFVIWLFLGKGLNKEFSSLRWIRYFDPPLSRDLSEGNYLYKIHTSKNLKVKIFKTWPCSDTLIDCKLVLLDTSTSRISFPPKTFEVKVRLEPSYRVTNYIYPGWFFKTKLCRIEHIMMFENENRLIDLELYTVGTPNKGTPNKGIFPYLTQNLKNNK